MKANVTPSEFADLVCIFLLQKLLYPEEVVFDNEPFNEIMESMNNKGMRSLLLNYYLSLPSDIRVKYKMIAKTLNYESNEMSLIQIKDK
jgi:hypothetical protein